MARTNIARPAARKGTTQRTTRTPSKAGARKRQDTAELTEQSAPRRKFVELPKIQGELPTPTATFVF